MWRKSSPVRGWPVLPRVALFFVACVAMLIVATPLARAIPHVQPAISIGWATSAGTLLLTYLFVRWDGVTAQDVGIAPDRRSVIRLLAGFTIGLVLVAINTLAMWSTGHVTWVRAPAPSHSDAAMTLVAFVLLASREELAFHGYPLRRLECSFGLGVAQAVVALVFALEHVAGGAGWKNAFLGSGIGALLFGMAAIASRGLAMPIGLHAAWNVGDWIRGGKDSSGLWRPIVDQEYATSVGMAGMGSYIAVFLMTTFGLWMWHRSFGRSGHSIGVVPLATPSPSARPRG